MARPKPLADFIDPLLGPALAAQGFASSDVIVAWRDIVGERLAEFSEPLRLDWPRRPARADPEARPEPATLVVRIESAFALEMQHLAPLLIERVNAHYGWRCVGRIVLKQGPVARRATRRASDRELPEEERRRVLKAAQAVEDGPLRGALERLGNAIAAAKPRSHRTKP